MNAFSTKLEAIPTDFKALDFTDKGLAWFPPSVLFWWTNIQVLDLSNNSLYFLPQEIPFLRHLAVLRLSKNNLLQIDRKDLGALGCLQELDFTGNRLRKMKGLRKLRLHKLKIGGNRLKRLPHLPPTVQRLEAGGNPYSSCNIAKLQHSALYSLDLSRSSLSEIPSKLERATNLETLILAGNQLTTIPTSLSSLAKLVTLVLSENPLGCIPPVRTSLFLEIFFLLMVFLQKRLSFL
jgi:Leucine-rich repeat (LRR) protein